MSIPLTDNPGMYPTQDSAIPIYKRLMVPLSLALLALFCGVIFFEVTEQQHSLLETSQQQLSAIPDELGKRLMHQVEVLASLEEVLLSEPHLYVALKARDQQQLLRDYRALFTHLKERHSITHFYFHLPNGVNLLRLHQPERSGDRIVRTTLQQAQSSGKSAHGIELGPLGTFTLRVVRPVFSNHTLIGYIELGKEIEDILHEIHQDTGLELLVSIDKGFLNRAGWEKGMKMLSRTSDWDRFADDALIYWTEERLTPNYLQLVSTITAETAKAREAQFGKQSWHFMHHPLQDASGTTVGRLFALKDISIISDVFMWHLLSIGTTVFIILLLLLTLLHALLRRTDRVIRDQQAILIEQDAELRIKVDEAEAANRIKSQFISRMSHELRTPMNAILGFAQLIDHDEQLSLQNRDSVQEIMHAGQHLLTLINEVLDLSKIESGNMDLVLEPVAIRRVIDECLNLIAIQAQQRNIQIEMEQFENVTIRADKLRLKQVLLNLLSNAIKYNRVGGTVWLNTETTTNAKLRLRVTDTGPGIPAERHCELFLPFSRLDADNNAIDGTGIGLNITRNMIELMGGKIGLESTVGVGSCFWVELPLSSTEEKDLTDLWHKPYGTTPKTESIEEQYTVLYIEDNPSNLKLVTKLLNRQRHIHLITADTPTSGIELARTWQPDLILLDINLPEMDGYQVLETLRQMEALRNTPVVAVSARAVPQEIAHGRSAGFSDYLTKPLDVPHFYHVVAQHLEKRSLH